MIIYQVIGQRGAYSDWETWTVASYQTREAAQLHIDLIVEYLKAGPKWPGTCYGEEYDAYEKYYQSCPWDYRTRADDENVNNHEYDYAAKYSIEEVILGRHPDEYLEELPRLKGEK